VENPIEVEERQKFGGMLGGKVFIIIAISLQIRALWPKIGFWQVRNSKPNRNCGKKTVATESN